MGTTSISAVTVASCSIEVWRSNIQMVVAPGDSKLADHSFQQNSFDGILRFLKEVRYRGEKIYWTKAGKEYREPWRDLTKTNWPWRQAIHGVLPWCRASGVDAIVCTGFEQAGPRGEFKFA